MRAITFDTGPITRVRVDGVLIQGVSLDVAPIKAAKKVRMWTPKMQEDYLRQVRNRLTNDAIREDEAKVIMNKFTTIVEEA
jgi:hypothetical protein